jgi:nicotinate phosphoribosyltransferase
MGTMAHEFIMLAQGYHEWNPAYSNKYMLDSWVKEYGILNGIALTDTISTDVFLKDFQLTFATLFNGVRHDSGDPYVWGDKMINHYKELGINPLTKTLLFSDSLTLDKANELYKYFKDKCKVAFGIGGAWASPKGKELNIVIKPTEIDGQPIAKLSDASGKNMCKDPNYIDYLTKTINWRLTH